MPKEITTVLELTETHLKLIQVKDTPQEKILTQILLKELTANSEEAIAKDITDLLQDKKMHPEEVICVLPRNQTTIRMLRLPSVDPVEIDNMVNLQVAKHTPYTREDVVVDYLVGGKDMEGYSSILLVIVHKDAVNRYINIFKQANLHLGQLILSSQGICDLYLYYQNKLRLPQEQEVVAILDIDKLDTEICFYYQGRLVFSRALQFGIQDITEAKVHSLFEELRLTIATFNKEKIFPAPQKMILTNASQSLEIFSSKIETELSLVVEVIRPQEELFKERTESLSLNWLEGDISANAALGLALQPAEKTLNLLPNKLIAERREIGKKKEIISVSILLLIILALVFFSLAVRFYKKSQYLSSLIQKKEKSGPQVNNAELMVKKIELIKDRINPKFSVVDIIYELYDKFPAGMSLNVFELDENGNISLQGTSYVMADVFNLQGQLEKSPRFKNVEVKFASKRNTRLGEVTDFKIICQVERKTN